MKADELLALVEKMTPGPYESGIWIVTAADGSGVFGTNMASKDQDQCRANGDGAAALYNHAASIITALQAERDALRAAAMAVDALYPLHWDRVDGAAVVMPERIPQFEQAFADLGAALARSTEPSDG
ncbi:MAG TPA: hypothetical protein VFZ38_10680 [Vicinamibacterales bacterium]